MIFCKGAAVTKMQIERDDRETTVVEAMLKVPDAGELLGRLSGLFARRIRIHARMKELSLC